MPKQLTAATRAEIPSEVRARLVLRACGECFVGRWTTERNTGPTKRAGGVATGRTAAEAAVDWEGGCGEEGAGLGDVATEAGYACGRGRDARFCHGQGRVLDGYEVS